ncbi:MAG: phosphoglycerate kinase [Candidatus Roizmanbacteria bacterium]
MAIKYVDEVDLHNKRILMRADFNVSLNENHSIANDERIRQAIPTIKHLLSGGNKLILCSHLGQPKGYEAASSLTNIAVRLQKFIDMPVTFYGYDQNKSSSENIDVWSKDIATLDGSIALIDNLRFFSGEKENDQDFSKKLASMADVYVGDAFGVAHRSDASVVGVPALLPHYGGLLMKKEINMIGRLIENPAHPFIAIIGGAKVDTKLGLITKLSKIADYVLVGGKLALESGLPDLPTIIKPVDYIRGDDGVAYDIGPETVKKYTSIISTAKTILWNGPMGKNEDSRYAKGTDGVYEAIITNRGTVSVIGGGDTITAIANEQHLEQITHISTGGGAMLEFIEKGTLPGIEALSK